MINAQDKYEKIINFESLYCYPGTNVLINKLGIMDKKLLEDVERGYSTYKLSKIYLKEFTGNFDINHYLDIHKYIFEDLYDFAGEIRNENINKSGIPFCRPEFIGKYLKCNLLQMKKDLKMVTDEDSLLNYLAHYYGEIDIIHPFREGNGRVQREFFRQYLQYINKKTNFKDYKLEYSRWTKEDKKNLIEGCIISAKIGDTSLLKHVLSKSLVKVNEQEISKQR
ncbi:MAG: Fic family protein [Bacilli bacterium]|nr:Fic family protein [Bacilli bacterium]MDD4282169.1 Fic family protein [Bacilli bacterium]MDD4718552.1 Fic family protein [Bacilli bacterium]